MIKDKEEVRSAFVDAQSFFNTRVKPLTGDGLNRPPFFIFLREGTIDRGNFTGVAHDTGNMTTNEGSALKVIQKVTREHCEEKASILRLISCIRTPIF